MSLCKVKLLVVAILGQCLQREHFWNVLQCVVKSVYEAFGRFVAVAFPTGNDTEFAIV